MKRPAPVEWQVTVSTNEVSFYVTLVPREVKKRWPEARAKLLDLVKEVDTYAKRLRPSAIRLRKVRR